MAGHRIIFIPKNLDEMGSLCVADNNRYFSPSFEAKDELCRSIYHAFQKSRVSEYGIAQLVAEFAWVEKWVTDNESMSVQWDVSLEKEINVRCNFMNSKQSERYHGVLLDIDLSA